MNATPYLLEAGTPDGCAFRRKTFHIFSRVITASTVVAMLGTILYLIFALASMYHGSRDFDWLLGIFSDLLSLWIMPWRKAHTWWRAPHIPRLPSSSCIPLR